MVDSDRDQTRKILDDENAASVIQRAWRRRQRRRNGVLDVQARWEEVAIHAKLQTQREAANQGRNDPLSRWKRAAFLAGRLGGATDGGHQLAHDEWRQHSQTTIEGSHLQASYTENVKILETQHWLELTDSKHRYGSNCSEGIYAFFDRD
ncbi:hypothetical protein PNOK_0231300 [Pyrrhoderma noxium]|uniref:Uncharacterized protein n=1 Tax=Pyrrhoderma noxium TaxID=2282107 RepID=A0A286URX9_9AGAM|nr:hypothetical protein PNOK_0231300 [Pyrrhoderma noxium]